MYIPDDNITSYNTKFVIHSFNMHLESQQLKFYVIKMRYNDEGSKNREFKNTAASGVIALDSVQHLPNVSSLTFIFFGVPIMRRADGNGAQRGFEVGWL